ncbi:MAG: undecaprenyl-diphosphate phosphatase [Alphaproteobacteria bacterium]|nr:undecaprenyl-diphosphate phosphatase [Alphaproteobacteria bacterium]
MSDLQTVLLALLQGITEFLPVSSSGHLILFSKLGNFPDQGIAMDVALHIGSIIAVIIYFFPILWEMLRGLWKSKFLPNMQIYGSKVFYLLVIATIPALVCGAILKYCGTEWLRSTKLIGWNILIYGLLLWFFDSVSLTARKIRNLEIKDAVLIGLAQCLALLPGTSRSGVTITMCRMLAMERREAATFSMLMSIPVILAAGIISGYELWQNGDMQQIAQACNAIEYSFVFSILAIFILMQWLKKWSFFPFVIYRVILGTALLLDAYGIYNIKDLFF